MTNASSETLLILIISEQSLNQFERCYTIAKMFKTRQIYGLSYYFDRYGRRAYF
jgi:hypothetical protein